MYEFPKVKPQVRRRPKADRHIQNASTHQVLLRAARRLVLRATHPPPRSTRTGRPSHSTARGSARLPVRRDRRDVPGFHPRERSHRSVDAGPAKGCDVCANVARPGVRRLCHVSQSPRRSVADFRGLGQGGGGATARVQTYDGSYGSRTPHFPSCGLSVTAETPVPSFECR